MAIHYGILGKVPALLGTLAALASCDPGVHVVGTVRDGSGKPLANASVVVNCPESKHLNASISTDTSGRFELHRLGCMEPECTVTVTAPSKATRTQRVGDACRRHHYLCGPNCNEVQLDVVLP